MPQQLLYGAILIALTGANINIVATKINILWVPFPMEINVSFYPVEISLLCPIRKSSITYMLPQLIEKTLGYRRNTRADIIHEFLPSTGMRSSIGKATKHVNDQIQPLLSKYPSQ